MSAVNVKAAERMSPEQLRGKFTVGLLHQEARPEYSALYAGLVARVRAEAAGGAKPGAAGRPAAAKPPEDGEMVAPEEGLAAAAAEAKSGAGKMEEAGA